MQVSTDWVGLIDEWAVRFFQELDYEREARNATVFKQQMSHLTGITVAEVYNGLTKHEVLTTAWVQGAGPCLCSHVFNHGGCSIARRFFVDPTMPITLHCMHSVWKSNLMLLDDHAYHVLHVMVQSDATSSCPAGEKLSESTASDVRQLCSTLLNCYLIQVGAFLACCCPTPATMVHHHMCALMNERAASVMLQLLETGLLHADPHPGNLLRTVDGRICILDFGMMTEVAPERQLALVEYIAHLSVQDWPGVARDLVKLGFTPEGLRLPQSCCPKHVFELQLAAAAPASSSSAATA
jgi:hypothetical protein